MKFCRSVVAIKRSVLLSGMAVMLVAALPAYTAPKGTGLPLPRFVSARANVINLRTGPGVQHPVEWVYQRRDLPLEIIAEYRNWRKTRDWQGALGWIHQSMLGGRRTFIVTGAKRPLHAKSEANAAVVALLEPGVVGKIVECPDASDWCQVSVGAFDGWLQRRTLWGVYDNEVVR
jgi:SH3-like domain-containing protein